MSPTERGQVVTCLAALLVEASEDSRTAEERADDRR